MEDREELRSDVMTAAAAEDQRPYLEPRTLCIARPGDRPVYLPIYADRSYSFGRSADADVVLPSATVSRNHARLSYRSDGRWVFRDLGSLNGSFLSEFPFDTHGEPLLPLHPSRPHVVGAGQAVILAKGCRITFLHELPEGVTAAATEASAASAASLRLEELVAESALHRLPVFLLGPTGSGKTYFARRIHELSGVSGPFESLNCGALPKDATQLKSELLGHVAGAFTGAEGARLGRIRHADKGTLFLDEVESMPEEAQRFVLDLLERTGDFAPLGAQPGQDWPAPSFRLIAASKAKLAESGLRRDLVFRLGMGTVIPVPSLEQRREDIPALVQTFLRRMHDELRVNVRLTDEAIEVLKAREWPGHVRELEGIVTTIAGRAVARARLREQRHSSQPPKKTQLINFAEARAAQQAVALPQGGLVEVGAELLREHLEQHDLAMGSPVVVELAGPPPPAPPPQGARKRPGDYSTSEFEAALARHDGALKGTAEELGMSVNTLKAYLKKLDVRRQTPA